MKRLPEDELGRRLVPYLERAGLDPAAGPAPGAVAALLRDRVATLAEMADAAHYFYAAPHPTPERLAEHVDDGESRRRWPSSRREFADRRRGRARRSARR